MYKGLVQGLGDKYSIYFTKEEALEDGDLFHTKK